MFWLMSYLPPSQHLPIQVVQFDRCAPRHRDVVGAPRLFICWMGLWYPVANLLRGIDVLHVGVSVVEILWNRVG